MVTRDRTPFGQRMHRARREAEFTPERARHWEGIVLSESEKAARKKVGLTQEEVEVALKIGQSTLSEAERNTHGSTDVVRFADLYGVNVRWLALGEGPMKGTLDEEAIVLTPEETELIQALRAVPRPGRQRFLREVFLALIDGNPVVANKVFAELGKADAAEAVNQKGPAAPRPQRDAATTSRPARSR